MDILFYNLSVCSIKKYSYPLTSNHLERKTDVSRRYGACELAVGYLPAHYYFLDPEKYGCKRLRSGSVRRLRNPVLGHA